MCWLLTDSQLHSPLPVACSLLLMLVGWQCMKPLLQMTNRAHPPSSAQACGIGMGLQLLQTSAPQQRPALAEAAGLQDVQPRGLETSTSNLSLLTVSG